MVPNSFIIFGAETGWLPKILHKTKTGAKLHLRFKDEVEIGIGIETEIDCTSKRPTACRQAPFLAHVARDIRSIDLTHTQHNGHVSTQGEMDCTSKRPTACRQAPVLGTRGKGY